MLGLCVLGLVTYHACFKLRWHNQPGAIDPATLFLRSIVRFFSHLCENVQTFRVFTSLAYPDPSV